MDKTIAQLNIAHFREKLETETDETTRRLLRRLLADEEANLAALNAAQGRKPTAWAVCGHSRQCVGRTSTDFLVSALIQP
jgi:hypothetical protein